MPAIPLWLALVGLVGNSAVAGVMWDNGDMQLFPLFAALVLISFYTCLAAGPTAVRTAEKGTDV